MRLEKENVCPQKKRLTPKKEIIETNYKLLLCTLGNASNTSRASDLCIYLSVNSYNIDYMLPLKRIFYLTKKIKKEKKRRITYKICRNSHKIRRRLVEK